MAYMDRNDIVVLADEIRTLSDQTYMLREEGEELQEEVEALVDKKAPAIINHASGAIASFSDGADDVPIKGLKFNIKPQQDLHGYSYPWPGGGGVNLLPPNPTNGTTTTNGVTCVAENGVYKLSGTASASTTFTFALGSTINLSPSTNKICFLNSAVYGSVLAEFWRDSSRVHYWGLTSVNRAATDWTDSGNENINIFKIQVPSGTAFSGTLTLSPMLMLKTQADPTSFSPYSNISPISGWSQVDAVAAGKNLLDADGYTLSAPAGVNQTLVVDHPVYLEAGVTYTFSCRQTASAGSATRNRICVLPANSTSPLAYEATDIVTAHTHYVTYTPSTSGNYRPGYWAHTLGNAITLDQWQVEKGSTATAYAAPALTPITIALGQTVYGGTVDALAGEGVKKMGVYDMGTLSWNYSNGRFFAIVTGLKSITSQSEVAPNAVCSMFKATGKVYSSLANGELTTNNANFSASPYVIVVDSRYSDAASFKAAVTGQTLVYELATPIEVDLTPVSGLTSLLGQNNVWCNTGDTEVEYVADTKLYIEKLTQPTEDDMVANANIESGKYFMVGNNLYLSTAAISAGETINPGTNCTLTNLAAALNAINA